MTRGDPLGGLERTRRAARERARGPRLGPSESQVAHQTPSGLPNLGAAARREPSAGHRTTWQLCLPGTGPHDGACRFPVPGPLGRGRCSAILQAQVMPVPRDAGREGHRGPDARPGSVCETAEPGAGEPGQTGRRQGEGSGPRGGDLKPCPRGRARTRQGVLRGAAWSPAEHGGTRAHGRGPEWRGGPRGPSQLLRRPGREEVVEKGPRNALARGLGRSVAARRARGACAARAFEILGCTG